MGTSEGRFVGLVVGIRDGGVEGGQRGIIVGTNVGEVDGDNDFTHAGIISSTKSGNIRKAVGIRSLSFDQEIKNVGKI